jgi:DNA-binding NtrC family response regulator
VILFTARGTVQSAALAFKSGADDFFASDDVEIEQLIETIRRSVRGACPRPATEDLAERLVGSGSAMCRVRERMSGLAPLRSPVLIYGEPGSGCNNAVQALHDLGSTAGGTLVRIGAADADARLNIPDARAVYLDGIERFPLHAQSFWSKWITEREANGFDRGPRVLASVSDPSAAVSGTSQIDPELRSVLFRYAIELPALRTIRGDIPEIADALVARLCTKIGRRVRLSPSARNFLVEQNWPDNIRQLDQLLERCIAFTRGRQVRKAVVQEVHAELEESLESIREHHALMEREALVHAIRETGGNVTRTAEILGKSRGSIYRLIEKHGIPLGRGGKRP